MQDTFAGQFTSVQLLLLFEVCFDMTFVVVRCLVVVVVVIVIVRHEEKAHKTKRISCSNI